MRRHSEPLLLLVGGLEVKFFLALAFPFMVFSCILYTKW
jgi:hypothetical protein